jgi:hypothetical protein
MLRKGDRVRLLPAIAEMMTHGLAPHRKKVKTEWLTRIGTVVRTPEYSGDIQVKWDDRKAPDYWPKKALEKLDG